MAARAAVFRLTNTKVPAYSLPAIANQSVSAYRGRKHYHRSTVHWNETSKPHKRQHDGDPIAASMAKSTTPTGNNTTAREEDAKNAAVGFIV